jgi:hypothetical protein
MFRVRFLEVDFYLFASKTELKNYHKVSLPGLLGTPSAFPAPAALQQTSYLASNFFVICVIGAIVETQY